MTYLPKSLRSLAALAAFGLLFTGCSDSLTGVELQEPAEAAVTTSLDRGDFTTDEDKTSKMDDGMDGQGTPTTFPLPHNE